MNLTKEPKIEEIITNLEKGLTKLGNEFKEGKIVLAEANSASFMIMYHYIETLEKKDIDCETKREYEDRAGKAYEKFRNEIKNKLGKIKNESD